MTLRRTERAASAGMLLAALLTAAGCTDRKPPETQRSFDETPVTPPAVPPVPVPAQAPPSPAPRAEAPKTPPPAIARSNEAQMQDDAEASGMTSRMPATTDDTASPASGNSN